MISLEMCAQELDTISDVSLKGKSLNQEKRLSIVFTFTATSSITGRNEALKNKFLPLAQILVIHIERRDKDACLQITVTTKHLTHKNTGNHYADPLQGCDSLMENIAISKLLYRDLPHRIPVDAVAFEG